MNNISNILYRETSRKEFLILLGLFILSVSGVSGVSGVLKNLSSFGFEKNENSNLPEFKKVSHGFSHGAYGA